MESVKSPALGRTAWRLRQAHMALRCAAPSALSVCALSAAGKMRHVHIGTQLLSLFGHAADACAHLQVKETALGWSLFRHTTSPRDRSRRTRAGGRSGGVCLVVPHRCGRAIGFPLSCARSAAVVALTHGARVRSLPRTAGKGLQQTGQDRGRHGCAVQGVGAFAESVLLAKSVLPDAGARTVLLQWANHLAARNMCERAVQVS
jgi:hypothetical protein